MDRNETNGRRQETRENTEPPAFSRGSRLDHTEISHGRLTHRFWIIPINPRFIDRNDYVSAPRRVCLKFWHQVMAPFYEYFNPILSSRYRMCAELRERDLSTPKQAINHSRYKMCRRGTGTKCRGVIAVITSCELAPAAARRGAILNVDRHYVRGRDDSYDVIITRFRMKSLGHRSLAKLPSRNPRCDLEAADDPCHQCGDNARHSHLNVISKSPISRCEELSISRSWNNENEDASEPTSHVAIKTTHSIVVHGRWYSIIEPFLH
ncbi:hypothetical protein EVAR_3633_1 [Eumeta japonica]|uniref:Uncharacterized protein n=1 Tax=Eumeta variegata TaxID=151549 RepID=A0A4C1SVU3_EUMVA|nr:hypothetical protein EVAR_3633_1 [Eumeta japonica]